MVAWFPPHLALGVLFRKCYWWIPCFFQGQSWRLDCHQGGILLGRIRDGSASFWAFFPIVFFYYRPTLLWICVSSPLDQAGDRRTVIFIVHYCICEPSFQPTLGRFGCSRNCLTPDSTWLCSCLPLNYAMLCCRLNQMWCRLRFGILVCLNKNPPIR